MVLFGYFYRETHEATSADASWSGTTDTLGEIPSSTKSIGTTAMKPSAQPTTSFSHAAVPSSYFASLTRQASNLASTVGLNSMPDISFGATSDGSLFEFSESQRQKARSILNDAAAAATFAASPSSSSLNTSTMRLSSTVSTPPSVTSSSSSIRSSPDLLARGRSSSVWSSSASSVNLVTQRGKNTARGNTRW